MKNKNSKKGITILALCFIGGFIGGLFSIFSEDVLHLNFSKFILTSLPNSITYILIFVNCILILLATAIYTKVQKIFKKDINSLTEEEYFMANKKIDIGSYLSNLLVIFTCILLALTFDSNLRFLTILFDLIYFVLLILFQKLQHTLQPETQIDPFSVSSSINSFDEIQKQILDKICRKTYFFTQGFLIVLLLIFMFITPAFKISYGYLLLLGFINIVVFTVFMYYDLKIEHSQKLSD